MKITELKLGDWVMYNSEPLRIAEIDLFLCSAWDKNEYFHEKIIIDYLTPIPLTEEILKKNEWEEDVDKYGYAYYQHNGWYRLLIAEEKGSWVFSHYDDFLTTIRYVHELQHLLWALGMDDDLKI